MHASTSQYSRDLNILVELNAIDSGFNLLGSNFPLSFRIKYEYRNQI